MKKILLSDVSILAILVIAAGALLHVAGIFQPFLGNFAQHQTDYATVVQRWLATSIDPLNPVMRFLAHGKNRLFYGDFPLNVTIVAIFCKGTGWSIEAVGRGLSAFYFFASLYPFYRLLQLVIKDRTIVLWSLFFYSFSPLTLIYGQSFLLEMSALTFGIFAYYCFFRWYYGSPARWLMGSALFFSLTLATRIYFAPAYLPILILLCRRYRLKIFKQGTLYLFLLAGTVLPILWHIYASLVAGARGDESSILDNLRVFVLKGPTRLGEFINPLKLIAPIFDIFVSKVVSPAGFVLAALGVYACTKDYKKEIQFLCLVIASFALLFVAAPRKFVEFEYYYLPFVPPMAILAAYFVRKLIAQMLIPKWGNFFLIVLAAAFSLRYAAAPMLVVPDEDRHVLESARAVIRLVPPEARVIASHGNSTSFLYYTDRDGWNFTLRESGLEVVRNFEDFEGTAVDRLERYRTQGAHYFALSDKRWARQNPDFILYLKQRYALIYDTGHAMIFDLQRSA